MIAFLQSPVDTTALYWSALFQLVCVAMFFCWLFWAFYRRNRNVEVSDGPVDEPYKIYTTEFDQELPARSLDQRLAGLSFDSAKGHFQLSRDAWNIQSAQALEIAQTLETAIVPVGPPETQASLNDAAILLLVDQSGSLKGGPMTWTAAGVRHLGRELSRRGANVAILGFSTAGWHGGFARQKWLNSGRPRRPGRLCALLHIVYQDFDEQDLSDEAWHQMLNPNLLRENVDGEAIEWAERFVLKRAENYKAIVVLSDGASVDDSTLCENGPSYLERHLLQTIGRILAEGEVGLGAIGLGDDVGRYYPSSRRVEDASELVIAGLALAIEMRVERTARRKEI